VFGSGYRSRRVEITGMGTAPKRKENARVKRRDERGLLPRGIAHLQVNIHLMLSSDFTFKSIYSPA
jgi:hypothetical protein